MSSDFTKYHTFNKRKAVATKISEIYSDRVAVVIDRLNDETPNISRTKYLVARNSSFDNFTCNVRKHITKIDSRQGLFFFVNGTTLIPNGAEMSTIYNRYKNEDGFLYLTYALENTYG